MRRLAFALLGTLMLGAGLSGAPEAARADEIGTWRSPPPRGSERVAPRRIVRTVTRTRPVVVYRTRRVVREVVRVVERPVYLRPQPVYEEVFVEGPYGPPPPPYLGPRPFRPRPVFYGPGYGPVPFGPRRFGGWGGGPFF